MESSLPVVRGPAPLLCAECSRPVDLPQQGWRAGLHAYCSQHWVLASEDPFLTIKAGALEAMDDVRTPIEDLVRWPWYRLHEMAGFLKRGRVHYVAAFPAGGKTKFLAACLKAWLERFSVCYLPLEATREESVARLAADLQQLDIDDIQSGELAERAHNGDTLAAEQLDRYEAQLQELALDDQTLGSRLWIHSMDHLNTENLALLERQLTARGVDILVVDHVDHIDAESSNEYRVSSLVQHTMLRIAKKLGIVVVLATQLNSKATGGNRIAKLLFPAMEWLWMKGVKEANAACVIGLFRPMRADMDSKEMDRLRRGEIEWWRGATPNRMAIGMMKLRYRGKNAGKVVQLALDHGSLRDLTMTEQFELEQSHESIRTSYES